MAWSGDDSSFQDFVDRHGLTFPQLSDPAGVLFEHFEVPVQPAFVLIDGEGRAERHLGAFDEAELDDALDAVTSA